MVYREPWVADILCERNILDAALDVHMTNTGSMERPDKEQDDDIRALRYILKTWSRVRESQFDRCVYQLIEQAIYEHSWKKDFKDSK